MPRGIYPRKPKPQPQPNSSGLSFVDPQLLTYKKPPTPALAELRTACERVLSLLTELGA